MYSFSVAAQSKLKKISKIPNAAMRIITGARKAILSLEAEAHLSPIKIRCNYKSANFYVKLMHRPVRAATAKVLQMENFISDNVCSQQHIFRGRIEHTLKNCNINNMEMTQVFFLSIAILSNT